MGRIKLTDEQKRIADSIRNGQGAATQEAPAAYRGGRVTLNQKQIQTATKYGLPNPDYGKNTQSGQQTVDDPLHRQYAAFMAYQNAVREAQLAQIRFGEKRTRNNTDFPDVLSEQEFGRSPAMQQTHGTYQDYLRGMVGQYQAAYRADIARQLSTGSARKEQTARNALDAIERAKAQPEKNVGKVTEQEFGRSSAMVARYGTYQNYLRGKTAGYDDAVAAGTARRAAKNLAAGKVSEAEFGRSSAMIERYGTYRNYLNGQTRTGEEIISSRGLADLLEQYYNAEGEEQKQLRQELAARGVSGEELSEWRRTVYNRLGNFAADAAEGFFHGGLLQNMTGLEGAMASLENKTNKAIAGTLRDVSGVLPDGTVQRGALRLADEFGNAQSTHEENARILQDQHAQLMQELTQGHTQAGAWVIEQMPSAGNMVLNAASAGMIGVPSLAALGTTAGGSAYIDARNDGASHEQALAYGLVNGALEVFSEKLFGGNPLYDTDAGLVNRLVAKLTGNKTVMRILNSKGFDLLSEGLEEVFTEITEPWAQALIYAGKDADFATWESAANAFAGGVFLSVAGNLVDLPNSIRSREAHRTINAVAEQVLMQAEMVDNEAVQQAAADVREKMDYGEDATIEDIGSILNAMSEAGVEVDTAAVETETEESRAQAEAEANERAFQSFKSASEEIERNQAAFQEATRQYAEQDADPYAERSARLDISDERSAIYAAEEAGQISREEANAALNTIDSAEAITRAEAAHVQAETTKQEAKNKRDAATAVERIRTQQDQADATLRKERAKNDRAALERAAAEYGFPKTLTDALPQSYAEYWRKTETPVGAAEYADAVHAAYQAGMDGLSLNAAQKAAQGVQSTIIEQAWNTGKEYSNGKTGKTVSDDGGKWDASMDPGKQIGAVAKGADQTAARQSAHSRAAERIELENRVRAAKQPYLSGKEIGAAKGAAEKSLQEVPKELWTPSIEKAAQELRTAGVEDIHFFIGKIGVVNQLAKVTRYANGMRTDSGVWVCANAKTFTVEQIARHEAFHQMTKDVPGVLEAVRAQIVSELGEDGIQALALRYAEAYEGCYDETELERYVAEICADAYAGMERFGEASKRAADAVWQTRQTEKSAEKPVSPRGPPEEYSIANTRKMPWKEQVQSYFKNDKTIKSSDSLYLGESDISGVTNSPLYIPTSVITKAIRPPKGSRSAHSLTQTDILRLGNGIKNAVAIVVNPERNAIVYLTENQDSAGNYVIAAFDMNNDLFGENAHKATSIHGRENIAAMLEKLGGDATIFVKNEDKLNQMLPGNQILESLELLAKVELDEQSIAGTRENVNTDFSMGEQTEKNEDSATQETDNRNLTMDTIPKKAQSYLRGAARNLAATLQRQTRLPFASYGAQIRESLDPLMNEYLQTGDIKQETIDKSFAAVYEKGVELEKAFYEKTKTLAPKLRQIEITPSERERAALDNYDVFKRRTKGRLNIVDEGGRPINAVYQEMSRALPEIFPRGVTDAAEQELYLLMGARRMELAKSNAEGADGKYAKQYKKTAKQDYENGVREMMGDLRVARRYAEAQARRIEPFKAPKSYEEVQELFNQQTEQRRVYERAARQYLLTAEDQKIVNRLLRGDITPESVKNMENADGILTVYEAKADYDLTTLKIEQWRKSVKAQRMETARQLLGNVSEAKDKKIGLLYKRETQERNARDVFKPEIAKRIIAHYFQPVHHAAAEETRLKIRMNARVEALDLSGRVRRGDKVSESAAVQLLGEIQDNIRVLEASRGRTKERDGKTLEEWDAVLNELWETSPSLDKKKIENAVKEFRSIYNELFQMMNETRVRNGYAPINYRSGYFPHFQIGTSDGILNLMGTAMGIDAGIEVVPTDVKGIFRWLLEQKKTGKENRGPDTLPTTINGRTGGFKPGITWFGNGLERTGFQTAYDAVKGFEKYLNGAAKVIYYTDCIQELRALATETRYLAGDDGLRERIDAIRADESLNDEQKDTEIEKIQRDGRYSLSGWAANLDEYTNLLAGKKSELDRQVEQITSRNVYQLLNKWQGRVAANMVAVNPASWLTNFGVIQQAAAQLTGANLMKARAQATANTFTKDGFEERSDFLTSRRGSGALVATWTETASEVLSKPMEIIDMYSANVIVRARYMDNLQRGMTEESAMQEADEFAAGVMADRSKGAMPTLFETRNPLYKMFTQFQLEVNNTFSYLIKDIPREQRKKGVAALAFTLLMYAVRNWLYNEGYEKMIGRRPMFDPIDIAADTVANYTGYTVENMWDAIDGSEESFVTKKEAKKPGAATWATMLRIGQEVPGIGNLLGGGRLPFASTMPDVENILNLLDKDLPAEQKWAKVGEALKSPAVYWLPPFGGGQAKKTYEGVKAVANKGSYKLNTDGEKQLQYPVYTDQPGDLIRAWTSNILFGKSATKAAREWVESGFKSLSAKETAAYQAITDAGEDQRKTYAFVQAIKSVEKEYDKKMLLKSYSISDTAKTAYFYQVFASEDQQKEMDKLDEQKKVEYVNNYLKKAEDDHNRDELRDAAVAGTVTREKAIQRMVANDWADDEDDAYWTYREWVRKAEDKDYKMYGDLLNAVESGGDVESAAKEYLEHGKEPSSLSSAITTEYKPRYLAAAPEERQRLKEMLLNAYAALGYNRSEMSKKISKWLKEESNK